MPYSTKAIRHYTEYHLQQLEKAVYRKVADLTMDCWVTEEPVPFAQRQSGKHLSPGLGDQWGKLFDCAWFHVRGTVPESAKGKKVVLRLDLGGEGCIFDQNGNPARGITCVTPDYAERPMVTGKKAVILFESAQGGESVDLWIDAGCNDLFGRYMKNGISLAELSVCSDVLRDLYYDYDVVYNFALTLDEKTPRTKQLYAALEKANACLRLYTEEEAAQAREILSVPLSKQGGDAALKFSAVGHAHMDLAWLWPIRETKRKGARTFSTALDLMNRYPDYIFGASQPQYFQWMKEEYPDLYARIRERVAQGRLEAQGCMWVEADTNVAGGEALVRQCLYGKRFYRDEFGVEMDYLWLPDVFGYSGNLPQILKKSGVDYFMTQKLSWSDTNRFPHQTFRWQGIDGSEVFTHMLPEETYNSRVTPGAVKKAADNYTDAGVCDEALILFGIGDGGGGPGPEHLERLNRIKNLEGLYPVRQEKAIDFFHRIEKNRKDLKTWKGELYLEFHRGTYTNQARNKRFNRLLELTLRECEWSCMLATLMGGKQYPKEELETIWKEVLLYQFHDILPGSSIKRVYDESVARYEILYARLNELIETAYKAVADKLRVHSIGSYAIFNSLPWERKEYLKLDGEWRPVTVPPMGFTVIEPRFCQAEPCAVSADGNVLENELIRVEFNAAGQIVSVFDKEQNREILQTGKVGNRFVVFADIGDAWDIRLGYENTQCWEPALTSMSFSCDGIEAKAELSYTFGASAIRQTVTLMPGTKNIVFANTVDWHENQKMLRVQFPVEVATDEAVCNIQYGNIRRSTLQNTSWDTARFEVCAHKFVDLSEADYGVALLNDCKYGYRVIGNVLDLNLLRSASHPGEDGVIGDFDVAREEFKKDPAGAQKGDHGIHHFTYALYPHKGDTAHSDVTQKAYELNVPLHTQRMEEAHSGANTSSFMTVTADNIVIESVKRAEDDTDLVIRLYESAGKPTDCDLCLRSRIRKVEATNLMEEATAQLESKDGKITLNFKPYEIKTVKIKIFA